jgi:hypothetical protein
MKPNLLEILLDSTIRLLKFLLRKIDVSVASDFRVVGTLASPSVGFLIKRTISDFITELSGLSHSLHTTMKTGGVNGPRPLPRLCILLFTNRSNIRRWSLLCSCFVNKGYIKYAGMCLYKLNLQNKLKTITGFGLRALEI